ncbi:hypothetical protein IVA80_24770 [Bradyrhizobium sp. 139]|uniref:hypothetical protein n=1 Tax=Bradyrhizobium sp. 139 TaxID=2782616 RepID=UPI001FFAFE00|nr:hypothetical protein [Bradyrhizobium sp. 139]MCK1743963.1 hypothetical protein [Bradyrhizobium sp. 139]
MADRAEVEVEILDLSSPVAEQPGFDAAAGDPAAPGLFEAGGVIEARRKDAAQPNGTSNREKSIDRI